MKDWKKTLVSPETPILDVMKVIDQSALQIALVVNERNELLGTVTDGDLRRAIIRGVKLDQFVSEIMNTKPIVCGRDKGRDEILAIMELEFIHHLPVVDKEKGTLIGLEVRDEITYREEQENVVVLMAGGLGSRLRPLTDDCPKPLLKVGNKPLLEIILKSFVDFGFKHFYFSVRYKSDMIEEYFGDGSNWGADIKYIHEKTALGTAGALSLLPERPALPLIVMNADLLTKVNFIQMLRFHREHRVQATMCVREYNIQIPYGVARMDGNSLVGIDEKPSQHFFVNAGIYVLEPGVLDLIPRGSSVDMPDLFKDLIGRDPGVTVFPIREYWLDIGQAADFDRANWEYGNNFGLTS